MVNIDNVYQKVLTLCNKEQRGYVTPQEFNLLADRAQNEIYENYFQQLHMAQTRPKSQEVYIDNRESIEHKLEPFFNQDTLTITTTGLAVTDIPLNSARIISIINKSTNQPVTKVDHGELHYILTNPLTKPNNTRRIYIVDKNNDLQFYPSPSELMDNAYDINYYVEPTQPYWAWVLVGEEALYNQGGTVNFQLHFSEEESLVSRILMLAGVTIKHPDVQQSGAMDIQLAKQQQNS